MDRKQQLFEKELSAHRETEPSARKSLGEYKPILQRREGRLIRTEVLARASCPGNKFARGLVFKTRDEAVAYAAEVKQQRIDDCIARATRQGVTL